MNKTVSTLALTLFAGMSMTAALPAADAEAGHKRTHCVQDGSTTNATNCPDNVRRKLQSTPELRRFNFRPDPEFGQEKVGGGAGGDGGGGGNRSDIRLKRDIAVIGKLPNGLKLYKFKYLWSNVEWVGVMAQDVLKVAPEAVITGKDGFYRVRYDLLGTAMKTFDQWQAELARIEDLPLAA
ncbi:MAG: tail fiber domain-containing protein [Rhizobiales bacterium]|nr:tail fiber domain-containing protein [Hyphomicrobiales bacterium]